MAKKQSTYYTHEVIAEHMAVKQDNLRSREVRKSTLYSLCWRVHLQYVSLSFQL